MFYDYQCISALLLSLWNAFCGLVKQHNTVSSNSYIALKLYERTPFSHSCIIIVIGIIILFTIVSRLLTFNIVSRRLGQLSLAIPSWVGTMSTSK